jgi:hypothetical protein
MRHLTRTMFIILLMAILITLAGCAQGNQAYPNPDQYPYPYTNP